MKLERGRDYWIDIDSYTVMGIDLAKIESDITCVVVVRKVGDKMEIIDNVQQHGNKTSEMLNELMAKYKLKIQDDEGGLNVFGT